MKKIEEERRKEIRDLKAQAIVLESRANHLITEAIAEAGALPQLTSLCLDCGELVPRSSAEHRCAH